MALQTFDLTLDQRFAALDDAKAAFVTKVYGTLALSLIVTTLACGFTVANIDTMRPFAKVAGFITLGMVILSIFVRLKGVFGWAFLWTFVTLIGISLGPLINAYVSSALGLETLTYALGLTATIFVGLTAYVRFTGKDFSWMGGFLWMATLGLIITSIAFFFFPSPNLYYWYSWVGALIFSGWILYDTSQVTRQYFQDNNVVGAVLNLYLDIVNLFLYLLSILSGRSRD
ncbi:MAG: hypothetical protein AMXMBFR7_28210 [Planctomycetota bacterium]